VVREQVEMGRKGGRQEGRRERGELREGGDLEIVASMI
jgi:hypothetical protein